MRLQCATPAARALGLLLLSGSASFAGQSDVYTSRPLTLRVQATPEIETSRPVTLRMPVNPPVESSRPVTLVRTLPDVPVSLRSVTALYRCAAADLDGDNDVDSADLNLLLAGFGSGTTLETDVDGDGDTDSADLNLVLAGFGQTCR